MSGAALNQFRQALEEKRPSTGTTASGVYTALDGAVRAMAAGAWQSSVATEFEHALLAHRTLLRTAADSATGQIDDAIAQQPVHVPADSWQARWFFLAAHAYR